MLNNYSKVNEYSYLPSSSTTFNNALLIDNTVNTFLKEKKEYSPETKEMSSKIQLTKNPFDDLDDDKHYSNEKNNSNSNNNINIISKQFD